MKLSWFRKYNKHILIWGGSLLMVAFLIEPALDAFMPKPQDEPVGEVDGREITFGDQARAGMELSILSQISPMLVPDAQNEDAVLRWLLMKHEARQMGLSASKGYEADALLTLMTGAENADEEVLKLASAFQTSEEFVRQTIQDWAMVQHYKELIYGLGHMPLADRISQYRMAEQALRFGSLPWAMMALQASQGQPRLSDPLLKRYAVDSFSQVSVEGVPVSSTRYVSDTAVPDEATLQALFDEYKDEIRGEGGSFGFGYRYPRRVAIEYLEIPARRLRDQIKLREADLYDYYQSNRDSFVDSATDAQGNQTGTGEEKPNEQVREQIALRLRSERAADLGRQMIKDAKAQLDANTKQLPLEGGYRVTADYEPKPLQEVADDLQRKYGVLPEVQRYDRLMSLEELESLAGVANAFVEGRPDATFSNYVMSAHELKPDEQHPLLPLGLQAKIASNALVGFDGISRYIFRLIEAEPSEVPASLDEVREDVVFDARRKAAYEKLLENSESWLQRAREEGLESLAQELGVEVVRTRPFARREPSPFGTPAPPSLPRIGQSAEFVDGVFDFVASLAAATEGEVTELPPDKRMTSVPVPQNLNIMLTRVVSFDAIPESSYKQFASGDMLAHQVFQALMAEAELEESDDPLSLENLKKRTGFHSDRDEEEKAEEDAGEDAESSESPTAAAEGDAKTAS